MMISYWNGLRIGALLALALLAVAECSRPARATTLYWDTDGSTAGNNPSTIQARASFAVSQNRRTKINTNASTNRGDAIIDVHGYSLTWYGSLQGGAGTLRVKSSGDPGGMLILGTDKIASINPFGTVL